MSIRSKSNPKPPRRLVDRFRPSIAVEGHGHSVPAEIAVRPGEGVVNVAIEHGFKALGYRLTPGKARALAELLNEAAKAADLCPSPED